MRTLRRDVAERFIRYGLVGGISTIAYGILTSLLIARALNPVIATALGYLLVVPLNFILQKTYAFRSKRAMKGELMRFFVVHGTNILATTGAMFAIVNVLHADYRIGIVLTMTIVPVVVFLMLDRWVFRTGMP